MQGDSLMLRFSLIPVPVLFYIYLQILYYSLGIKTSDNVKLVNNRKDTRSK